MHIVLRTGGVSNSAFRQTRGRGAFDRRPVLFLFRDPFTCPVAEVNRSRPPSPSSFSSSKHCCQACQLRRLRSDCPIRPQRCQCVYILPVPPLRLRPPSLPPSSTYTSTTMLATLSRPPRRLRLTDLSDEVLQHIAFFCAEPFLGTPANVVPFLLICRKVYSAVGFNFAPYLYGRIFRMKFDVAAPMRRLGEDQLKSSVLAEELRRRCEALKRIRRLEISGPNTLSDLWMAYLMFLEHDVKNARQLIEWANIRSFVMHYIRARLYENSQENRGWPLESDSNALAIWILWHAFDEGMYRCNNVNNFGKAFLN